MAKERKTSVIIAAAGSGRRMGGGIPKQYGYLGGISILARTVRAFADQKEIHQIIIVTNQDFIDRCSRELKSLKLMDKVSDILPGGQERQDSIYEAVRRLSDDVEIVLVHDGVRPFVTGDLIKRTIEAAKQHGAAVAAVPTKDTMKMVEDNYLTKTLDRRCLYSVQTPQGFQKELLVRAYEEAFQNNYYGTDDAVLVEQIGEKSHVVRGDYYNIKITTMEDIVFGEAILGGQIEMGDNIKTAVPYDTRICSEAIFRSETDEIRVGTGFDVHQLIHGRKLVLGGVELPFEKGLLGHSDADVLLHAIMDALLGAAAMGDIGRHFPDTDESYRGISSLFLLGRVGKLLKEHGYLIGNIDSTVIAQRPKILPYIKEMKRRISEVLDLEENRINIKGTTTERLGFCGREEGIAAQASVTIKRRMNR